MGSVCNCVVSQLRRRDDGIRERERPPESLLSQEVDWSQADKDKLGQRTVWFVLLQQIYVVPTISTCPLSSVLHTMNASRSLNCHKMLSMLFTLLISFTSPVGGPNDVADQCRLTRSEQEMS